MNRIRKGEPINNPNPLSIIPKINICNSFQLNNKAMSSTIRTLLNGDFSTIAKPGDISNAVAQKLRGHFGLPDSQLNDLSVTLEHGGSPSPYDNYQLGMSRAIPQKETETVGLSNPDFERRRGQATFKQHSNLSAYQGNWNQELRTSTDPQEESLMSPGLERDDL